jgi:hypothetical protein
VSSTRCLLPRTAFTAATQSELFVSCSVRLPRPSLFNSLNFVDSQAYSFVFGISRQEPRFNRAKSRTAFSVSWRSPTIASLLHHTRRLRFAREMYSFRSNCQILDADSLECLRTIEGLHHWVRALIVDSTDTMVLAGQLCDGRIRALSSFSMPLHCLHMGHIDVGMQGKPQHKVWFHSLACTDSQVPHLWHL